jgi:NAD(P)-dependent dehydrogenase (short-subunit alcohol dehydrogenase family)
MKIEGSVVLVTGANRGLGRAFVEDLLARGASRVYAASRDGAAGHADPRVVALELDITNPEQVREAAAAAPDVQLLVNNAGRNTGYSVLKTDPAAMRSDIDVNVYGTLAITRAFVPVLAAARQAGKDAAIANVLSVLSLASMPVIGGYCASKAALWSVMQSVRGELRAQGILVHNAFPGVIDTDMARGLDMPKTPASVVAHNILEGVATDQEDIAPDPMSADVVATFLRDPRQLERNFGAMLGG